MDALSPAEAPASSYRFLDRVNRWLGGDRAMQAEFERRFEAMRSLGHVVIADVGAGDGAVATRLVSWFKRKNISASAICIDIKPPLAPMRHGTTGRVHFVVGDALRLPLRRGAVDYAIASLMFHHLPDNALVRAFREAAAVARNEIIVNDLVRSPMAYLLTCLLTGLFGDEIVRNDGPLSVRKAFIPKELVDAALGAGLRNVECRRYPFFRLLVTGRGLSSRYPD